VFITYFSIYIYYHRLSGLKRAIRIPANKPCGARKQPEPRLLSQPWKDPFPSLGKTPFLALESILSQPWKTSFPSLGKHPFPALENILSQPWKAPFPSLGKHPFPALESALS